MEGNALSSYCERCGNSASIDAGTVHSCLECDRFICTDCWDARRQRCTDCPPLDLRASRARDLTLLRRVDRRLREVVRDASTMPSKVPGSEMAITAELAFLRLKASNAGEIGEAPLVRRVRGAKATEVEAFARRIRMHIRLADIAVARAEGGTQAAPDERATEVAHPRGDALGPGWRTQVVAAVAAAVAAALVVVVLSGDLDVGLFFSGRDGVLSGLPRDGSPVPSGSGGGTARSSPGAIDRVSLAFDFDGVRMGEGIGDAWDGHTSQAAESIQVAAFPTSFDRSARFTTTGRENATACAALVPQELQRLAFDVYLDPARPAVGTLSLYAVGDDAQLEIVIEAKGRLSARILEGELTAGPRIGAGAWRRVELIAEAGDLRWRVRSLGEQTTALADGLLGPAALAPITRICLAADGPVGGAISYDNIEIHGITSGG